MRDDATPAGDGRAPMALRRNMTAGRCGGSGDSG